MKNLILIVLTLLLFTIHSCCGDKYIEKQKEAIIGVVEESTNAYKAREINRLDSIYLHDNLTSRLNAGKYGFGYEKGWGEIENAYKEMFAENPLAITTKFEKKNFHIKVYRKSAFAFHDEIIYDSENEYQHHQIGVHFLEKVKGEWKILYLSYIDTSSYEETE